MKIVTFGELMMRLTPPHHDRLAGFYNDDDKEAL